MVCAVMSVTLLLVALADKTKQVQRPVEMILDMLMTGLFTQVTKIWIPLKQTSKPHSTTYQPGQGQKVLRYPLRKQYPCTYAKKGPIVISHTDPVLRLKGQRLEISNTHKILGLTFDISHLIWKTHIDKVRTKPSQNGMGSIPRNAVEGTRDVGPIGSGVWQRYLWVG
jgi:hypothetical protein